MIVGNITPQVIEIPTRDLPTFQVNVTKDTAAFDLTNIGAVTFGVFRNQDDADADALFIKTLLDGVAVVPPASGGIVTVTFSAVDVAKLSPNNAYFFRCVVTPPDNRPGAAISGYIILTP